MPGTLESLREQVELAEQLWAGRDRMLEPQDLPGRFGRVIRALDHLLEIVGCEAVLYGGWAVWRHGYEGRMTQDVDIVVAADRVDELLRVSAVAGFEVPPQPAGRWPKLIHKETRIKVDILHEGARPGTVSRPAPTTLPNPSSLGADGPALRYITLPGLIQLKLAAGRARDEAEIIELVRANPAQVDDLSRHLSNVHPSYLDAFKTLVERARDQRDE